jgi:hypothetical protein
MSYDTGTISRPNLIGSSNQNMGSSIDISFDSKYYFIGSSEYSSNTGKIEIFKYIDPMQEINANTFSSALYTLTGTSNDSKLGSSIKVNWNGTRVIVGEPGSNKVHIITTNGTGENRWNVDTVKSTVIESPDPGLDNQFGYSVSISKDAGNDIVIGAPGINKIYVYQINSSRTWNKVYENGEGSTVQRIKYDTNTFYDMISSSNSFPVSALSKNNYGYSVDITPDAKNIIAGAPGNTVPYLHNDNCSQIPYTFRPAAPNNNPPISELPHTFIDRGTFTETGIKRFEVFGFDDYMNSIATLGWVRTLRCDNADWSTTVIQLGYDIHGDTEDTFIENSYPSLSKHVNNVSAFDYTALGTCVRIAPNGDRIVVGSPRYSVDGTGFSTHLGKIETWLWNEKGDTWDKNSSALVGPNAGGRMGEVFNLDYRGERMVVLYKHPPNIYSNPEINPSRGAIHIFDWSGDKWYEVSPQIFLPNIDDVDDSLGDVAICSGEIIATGCTGYNSSTVTGRVYTHSFILTQSIKGNTIIGGYLSADTVYVGTNDGSTDTSNVSTGKKIQFGGTYSSDDNYASATIQNRTIYYDSTNRDPDQQGFSELLISKRFTNLITNEGALDQVRIKAPEFHIDEYMPDDLLLQQHPAMTKNALGDFKFNPEFIMPHECASANIRSKVDIEGDAYVRRRLNAGYYLGNQIKGIEKLPYRVFYDTRNREIIKKNTLVSNLTNGDFIYSNVNTQNTTPGPGWGRYDTMGIIEGDVIFDSDECAIQLANAHSRVYTSGFNTMSYNDTISANQLLTWKCSFWLKLTQTQDITTSLGGGSIVTLVERVRTDGTLTNGSMIKIQITSSPVASGAPTYALLLNYGTYLLAGDLESHINVGSGGFNPNQWYHIHATINSTFESNEQIIMINGTRLNLTHVGNGVSPTVSGTGSYAIVGESISGLLRGDKEGNAVDINSTGDWLISGAWKASTPILYQSGQVRIFQFQGGKWNQVGTKLEGTLKNESFGYDVSISDLLPIESSPRQYPRITVSARNWDSNKGYVKVYIWDINETGTSDGNWVQLGQTFEGVDINEYVGESISMSRDGTTIAIGRSTKTDVFTWNGLYGVSALWVKKGASFSQGAGTNVALSSDGSYIIIGTLNTSIGIWKWSGTDWVQQGNTITDVNNSDIGFSVDITADGQTIVFGQPKVMDINTNASSAGSASVYYWNSSSNTWDKRGADIYGSGRTGDRFGERVSIADSGNRIVVSTKEYDGSSNNQFGIGHARGYDWNGVTWDLMGYELVGTVAGESFGSDISISGDGKRVAIGVSLSSIGGEFSGATTVYSYAITVGVQTWAGDSKMVLGSTSGDSIQTAYIGMVGFETYDPDISDPTWIDPVDNSENRCNHPTYIDFLNYGAPSEKLVIGGDVKIKKDLQVDGNVNVNEYILQKAFTFFVHGMGGIWDSNTSMLSNTINIVEFDSYPGIQVSTKGFRTFGPDKGIYFAPITGIYFVNAKCDVLNSTNDQKMQWYIKRVNGVIEAWTDFEACTSINGVSGHRQHQSSTHIKLIKGEGVFPYNSMSSNATINASTFGGHFVGL